MKEVLILRKMLAFAPFQTYMNTSGLALSAYSGFLKESGAFQEGIDLPAHLTLLFEKGYLLSSVYEGFAVLHPNFRFCLNRQLAGEKDLRHKIRTAFANFCELYAEEIYRGWLESGQEAAFRQGMNHLSFEFQNFLSALYQNIFNGKAPFFLYASLITYAQTRHLPDNFLSFLEDICQKLRMSGNTESKLMQQFEGSLLNEISKVLQRMGRYKEAIERLEDALVIFQRAGDRKAEGYVFHSLGNVHFDMQHEVQPAANHYEQAAAIFEELGYEVEFADVSVNLSALAQRQKKLEKARQHSLKAIEILKKHPQPLRLGVAWSGLADVYIEQNEVPAALSALGEAQAIFEQYGDDEKLVRVLAGLGKIHAGNGNRQTAEEFYKYALEKALLKLPGQRSLHAGLLEDLGTLAYDQNKFREAEAYYLQAAGLATRPEDIGALNLNAGAVMARRKKYRQALPLLREALTYYENTENAGTRGKIYQNLGICHYESGMFAEAIPFFEKAATNFEAALQEWRLAESLEYLVYTHAQNSNMEAASKYLQQAGQLFEKQGRNAELAHFRKNAGKLQVLRTFVSK